MFKDIFWRNVLAYPSGHREQVHQRIVRSARKLFNRSGYEAVSIDAVMADAGLTRGAFYFHFESKAALFREAVAFVVADHPAKKWIIRASEDSRIRPEQIIDAYLSERHLLEVEESCPLVTHAAEAARGGEAVQEVARSVLVSLVDALSGNKASDALAPQDGLVLASLCVGGLSLARSVGDENLARAILVATKAAARRLLRRPSAESIGSEAGSQT